MERIIESTMYASRWLLAPIYMGLSLAVYFYADVVAMRRRVTSRTFTPGHISLLRFSKSCLSCPGFSGEHHFPGIYTRSRSLFTAIAFSVTTTVLAEQPQYDNNAVRWTLQAGAVYQSSASLDEGGDMSAGRYFVSGGLGKVFGGRWRLGASVGYGEDRYDFSGSNGFGALDPWDRTRELRLSVPVQYFANQNWTVYAIPSIRFNAESGASLNDGKNGGLIAGASYRVSDTLTIGPGFGVFSEIEDSTSFFPILIVDWKITDTLSLETGRGFAASRGPGLQLRWQTASNWEFAFGGRYEKTRFRLDDSGPAPDGVGQDKAFPLFALAEYAMGKDTRLSLIGGVEVGANMRLEDSNGRYISDSDLSTAPFFGATFQTKF